MTIDQQPPILSKTQLESIHNSLRIIVGQIARGDADRLDMDDLHGTLRQLTDLLPNVINRLDALNGQGASAPDLGAARRFETLYNFSQVLGRTLKLDDALRDVIDTIVQITGAERGFLLLRDEDGELRVKIARDYREGHIAADASQYSTGIVNQVASEARSLLSNDAISDPSFQGRQSVQFQVIRSVMASPLVVRNKVIGVAYVDSRLSRNIFQPSDLELLDAISSQAAVALDNAMLFSATDQALNRRIEELRDLRAIDLQLNATLDRAQAARITLEAACKLGNAEWGVLSLLDSDSQHMFTLASHGKEPDFTFVDVAYPQVWHGQTTDQPVESVIDNATCLIAPLRVKQEFTGVVLLARSSIAPFSDDERDLVQRVVTRAAISIENARLYAEVRASSQAKSRFVGYVAHELKTPMVSMRGYADLLLSRDDLGEKPTGYVRKIRQAVDRMMILTNDLSDISRIETGHVRLEETVVDAADLLHDVCAVSTLQLQERNHTLLEQIEPGLPPLWVDRDRLWQVLNNLLSNAIKYTPPGGTVTVSAQAEGDRVRFTVADTGVGMSAEEVARLGGHFWRAESDFVRDQPGTGLGFSISRQLVQLMGSQITIESKPGLGSRFSFSVATRPPTSG